MKKTLLLTSLLLAVTVSAALAAAPGGVNINWGTQCYTEVPVAAKTFACTANTGSWQIATSFLIHTPMPLFVGVEIYLEGQSDAVALPDWWKMGTGDCRAGKISFSSNNVSSPQTACFDWSGGLAITTSPGYTWGPWAGAPTAAANTAHVKDAAALDAGTPFDMAADVEYYAGTFNIANSKAVGTGACTGCALGMKWGMYKIVVADLEFRQDVLQDVIPGGNQCLDWNNPVKACVMPVPARNTTWGQVKSLYR